MSTDSRSITGSTLLLFSIGPVQDFIAAARSTRDLWSGSYLLSTLTATGLRCLNSKEVIFPCIEDQPLITGDASDLEAYLTPTLPNRFLALLGPEVNAVTKAKEIENSIQNKLAEIAEKVANELEKNSGNLKEVSFDRQRFDSQSKRLLEVQWHTLPVPLDVDAIKQLAKVLPADTDGSFEPRKGLNAAKSIEQCWGPLNSILAWLLDGTKSLREFDAWREGRWESSMDHVKDILTGKEEAVFSIKLNHDSNIAEIASALKLSKNGGLKASEKFGAANTIKRFWDSYYLAGQAKLPSSPDLLRKELPMPNTHAIAQYQPTNEDLTEPTSTTEKYFAIVAMDGDEMGKWISGQKHTEPLTIDDHADFSRRLNHFALHHARGMVEDSDGRLIYAGGDDVLAMVPAGNALSCAKDLREAFIKCFDAPQYSGIDASVGITIAHYKAPLQDVVKAAQVAEKRAKRSVKNGGLGRGAVAITIYKRSGEILEWGSKWATKDNTSAPGIHLLETLLKGLFDQTINSRFPHKLEALLTPYLPKSESIQNSDQFTAQFEEVIALEIAHTAKRNAGHLLGDAELLLFKNYWHQLASRPESSFTQNLTLYINLLRTAAWLARGGKG